MPNHIVTNALNDLRNEANCYNDKTDREMAMNLIAVLEQHFTKMDAKPGRTRANPPGKTVHRDEDGNPIAVQG